VRSPDRLGRLRAAVAPVAKTALLHAGVYAAVRRFTPSRSVAILRYHAICGPEGNSYADPSIQVTPDGFERHVAYLARNYTVLPLTDIVLALRKGRTLPSNAVAITFDDGYADNLGAARLLSRHGLSATFYITAGCLAGEEPFWLSELRALVLAMRVPQFTLSAAGATHSFQSSTAEARQRTIRQLTRLFKSQRIPVREDIRGQLRRLAGNPVVPSPMLTWDDLFEMRRLGMTIGAHTLTHPNLPSAGLADARKEIEGARARLQRELGVAATMFSYPNGGAERYFTPEIQQIVRDAGYEAATTSANGFAGPKSDIFALERIQVSERLEDLIFALEIERFAFAPKERTYAGA
jgi:peptidoglycan/xylan/chitin deacetylase (PgdA/CDA1 family)